MLDEQLFLVIDFFDIYELWRFLLTTKRFTEIIKNYKKPTIKEISIVKIPKNHLLFSGICTFKEIATGSFLHCFWINECDILKSQKWGSFVDIKTKQIKINGKYQIRTKSNLILIFRCKIIKNHNYLFVYN